MEKQKINRINELYRKSKAEGLTEAEKKEQKVLRAEYLELVRRNLRGQLNNIDIEEKDGWGITVIGDNVKVGAGAVVPPKTMIDKDIPEVTEDARQ